MKKYLLSALTLMIGLVFTASCEDDRDSNPTLISPKAFILNTPAVASNTIDLAKSQHIEFTWQYPAYGFPAAVDVQMQYSVNGNFKKVFDLNVKPEEQQADFVNGDSIYSGLRGNITAGELAKHLQQLAVYKEDAVPATQKVYARGMAVLGGDTIYSNPVTLTVVPYYVELKDAAPVIWYLVGNCFGDTNWDNSLNGIGTSMVPFYTKSGAVYDKKTGTGTITYTGYFPAGSEFKIIEIPGNWDYGIGGANADKYRNGSSDPDPGNISIAEAGYYTIEVDTKAKVATLTKAAITSPKVYTAISLPGSHQGWDPAAAEAQLRPLTTTAGRENHDWVGTVTITADGKCKFAADNKWDVAWGATSFPYGVASASGGDIPTTAGTYKVFFNDLTGSFYFFAQ